MAKSFISQSYLWALDGAAAFRVVPADHQQRQADPCQNKQERYNLIATKGKARDVLDTLEGSASWRDAEPPGAYMVCRACHIVLVDGV